MTSESTTTIDPQSLRQRLDQHEDLVILDVRSAAEFEALHIPGSYSVPLPLVREHAAELAARLDGQVVLTCQSGVRAEQARARLSEVGVSTAQVLTGGVPGFAAAGGEVVRGAQRWDLERQVRMAAGALVLTGLLGGRFVSPKIRTLSGIIGTGLTFSAASNTCAMGRALSAMPWNRAQHEPTAAEAIEQIPSTRA